MRDRKNFLNLRLTFVFSSATHLLLPGVGRGQAVVPVLGLQRARGRGRVQRLAEAGVRGHAHQPPRAVLLQRARAPRTGTLRCRNTR